MKILNIFISIIFLISSSSLYANNLVLKSTYSDINDINFFIAENDYLDFIRSNLFDQPEFRYAVSLSSEQEYNLKYAKRNRFPTISGSIINDESIERNIKDNQSVRKRRDDSFDANLEIRQPIYAGGSINSLIRSAKNKPLDDLFNHYKEIDKEKEHHIHCAGGYRSVIYISILKSKGYKNLIDVIGGYAAIKRTNIPKTEFTCSNT